MTAITDADAVSGPGLANCRRIIEAEIAEAEQRIAALDNEF